MKLYVDPEMNVVCFNVEDRVNGFGPGDGGEVDPILTPPDSDPGSDGRLIIDSDW